MTTSHKHEPEFGGSGWSRLKIPFKDQRAPYELRSGDSGREPFAKNLHAGQCIGVYCGDVRAERGQDSGTDDAGNRFWIAQCMPKNRQSTSVLYEWDKPKNDEWRLKKGDKVLNVMWMERTNSSNPLVFKPGGLQTILMENILCLKVIWEKQTAGEHVLSQNQHDDYEELCDSVREPKGWGAGAGGGGRA